MLLDAHVQEGTDASDPHSSSARLPLIRYLGGKRRIAEPIVKEIAATVGTTGTIVDLFAGSHAVSTLLAPDFRVVANDVQVFSHELGRGLLRNPGSVLSFDSVWDEIGDAYSVNLTQLQRWFAAGLEAEAAVGDPDSASWSHERYAAFCSSYPYLGHERVNGYEPDFLALFSAAPAPLPSLNGAVFSTRFACSYFGAAQATVIDSLRVAIEVANEADRARLMTALIYTASDLVSAPGHFAQFLKPTRPAVSRRLAALRMIDPLTVFRNRLTSLFSRPRPFREDHSVHRGEALSLLQSFIDRDRPQGLIGVYADPPYTDDQYSRYYHILDTLVLYDNPPTRGAGRYRSGRFQSQFSLKSRARNAIASMVSKTRSLEVPLFLSYSSNGIVTIKDILVICKQHYPAVLLKAVTMEYSSQGRLMSEGKANKSTGTEYLVIATL